MKRTTKTKAAKPTKPAAKEVSNATIDAINRLNVIGKEIEARLVKADKYGMQSDDMLTSVNELLKEAETLCADHAGSGSVMSFATFKEKVCLSLGRTAAYELRACILAQRCGTCRRA